MKDTRLLLAQEIEDQILRDGERHHCETCERPLPRGLQRRFCLDHSEYAQQVMREAEQEMAREERRRRRPAKPGVRRAA